MSVSASSYTCSFDERRKQLEKTCVSLISAYLVMRGSLVNRLSAMPTKGTVVSKQKEKSPSRDNNMEGTSVDSPLSNNNHEDIARLVDPVVENSGLPERDIVPASLPRSMSEQSLRLTQDNVDSFFDVRGNLQRQLESGNVTQAQLVAMYLRSIANMLEYDLDSVEQMQRRYISFFGNVLADIMEMCYPHMETAKYFSEDERLLKDMKQSVQERR